ncbi:YslB family protein [Pseudalkalibacillus berkeleyi]|uniref:YslB family protein n=1 Tax=Pseudalkalibacillus berkeleyi TaxID=1069813 RepID=A0ABS9H2K0_9BACL|nr:YslB family protein [Pseudalkalibacillus berkeleyi]MCF6138149.1 YslB family protein [Pseudalkalibacillus berkeleyi]
MKKDKNILPQPSEKESYLFGYELLRDVLLPELLGKEDQSLLYWAGRTLARKYPMDTTEELIQFFAKANFGELTLKEETTKDMTFELTSERISDLLTKRKHDSFQLEAGFLAEQIQRKKEKITESLEEVKRGKLDKIIFKVQWDRKDEVKDTEENPVHS